MLENILNTPAPQTESYEAKTPMGTKKSNAKTQEDAQALNTSNEPNNEPKEAFKNILQKNLSKEKLDSKEQTKKESDPNKITQNTSKTDEQKALIATNSPLTNTPHKTGLTTTPSTQESKNLDTKTQPSAQTLVNSQALSKDTPSLKTPLDSTTQNKLSDIKTLAEAKNLQPQNLSAQNTPSAKEIPTQNILEQKLKTQSKAQEPQEDKPLSVALKTLAALDTKEIKARKKFNQAHKIEYKTEGKSEKIAIIERGAHLPKNIIANKLDTQDTQKPNAKDMLSKKPLQEAISQAFIKEIKPKTSAISSKLQEGTEENTQKKTKKPSPTPLNQPNAPFGLNAKPQDTRLTPLQSLQSQADQIQADNEEILKTENTHKKQNNTQAQKSKELLLQETSKPKDSTPTLGLASLQNDLIYKSTQAKETIKNFTQNFKEELKKFKPPMSKISLELYPEKIGKLELTIKQTGNNLQVSVISNQQAIALFVQNQLELKQNLAFIGFENIDLNFSSQGDSSHSHNPEGKDTKRNKNSLQSYQEVKNISQIPYDTMEITIPKYA
ncbi:hypothetical protein BKH46_04290 [Helicobacter sp. 12S02634-8]|uniref:flagellar hook-length control protein FliK n=1 Tax=Helicobacter sp. 12S02634-8 TaxID=1476199 RepID=UPI000BA593F9|nr:flagellar hook-length control protein FliK [Helicobacter sp. 12S02634-8]PAF47309.1 hypothetical protein BKH46_04290 [Helicobacter sp. 12S02634-8]